MKKIKIYESNDSNILIENVNNFIEDLKVYDIKFCVTVNDGIYNENWYHCMIIYEKDITSIVTKEQFESMEYKIGG